MLAYLSDIWTNLLNVVKTISIIDCLDMIILAIFLYGLIKLVRETRAQQLVKGIIFLLILLFILKQFDFKAMSLLSDTFSNVGIIALIIMFQPELRRVLEKVGRTRMVKSIAFNIESNMETSFAIMNSIDQTTLACEKLSRTATGALIVIERETKLGEQIDTGTVLNALPSAELFGNIFFPNTPLHDGAVIMRDGRIVAAGCFLPKPQKEELISKELGSRHRAAIGMSEISDAITIIVSEETGIISVAENGVLTRGFSKDSLSKLLHERLLPDRKDEHKKKRKKKNKTA